MPGDVSKPLGDLKGYQFWTIVGMFIIVATRVLLAYDISMGPFALSIPFGSFELLITDVIGVGLIIQANADYRGFVNRALNN